MSETINGHWWHYLKLRNIFICLGVLIALLGIFVLGYSIWTKLAIRPSYSTTLAYTVAPGGGGLTDSLTPYTLTPSIILSRAGENQGNAKFLFGPWDKTVKINVVTVHPIVVVTDNSTIEISLTFKGKTMLIGTFTAHGDPNFEPRATIQQSVLSLWSEHINWQTDLLIPSGDTGTVNFVSKDTQFIGISTDTYISFNVLQSRYGYLPPWWQVLVNNPLAVGILLAIFGLFAKGAVYETEAERREKAQLRILENIRDILKPPPPSNP